MRYYLMHENTKVAMLDIDSAGQVLKAGIGNNELSNSLVPVGISNLDELKKWVKNRGIPISRQSIKQDLTKIGNYDTFDLMLLNNGISLTDHYWIKNINDANTWETVNPYTNNFRSVFTLDLVDDMEEIVGKTNFVPSVSLKGDLKKKWIIDQNGVRRLVKGNYGRGCRQSLCEVIATELHGSQGIYNFLPYTLIKISTEGQMVIGCECPCFTSTETEFISAIDIVNSAKKPNDISYYEWFIMLCYKQGIDVRAFLEYQIMTDFIITNQDRHLNNFGIIRDSNNLRWIGMAPLFDSGNSLFYNSSYVPVDKALLKIQVTSFLNKEVELLRYVTNRGLVNPELLPDDNYMYRILSKDVTSSQNEIERIITAYRKKIKYFVDFQNGADLWSYKYKG